MEKPFNDNEECVHIQRAITKWRNLARFLLLALFPFLCLAIMFASCVSFLKYLFAFIIVKPFVIPFPPYHRLLKEFFFFSFFLFDCAHQNRPVSHEFLFVFPTEVRLLENDTLL